jgi:hypothetical protein
MEGSESLKIVIFQQTEGTKLSPKFDVGSDSYQPKKIGIFKTAKDYRYKEWI